MTVDLHSPSGGKVHCTGVVVGCQGDRHSGYVISVLFMNLSRQAQTHLSDLVISRLA